MPNISICPFCGRNYVDYDFELEERLGCDCYGFQRDYGCNKSNCQKLKEDGDYCWEHVNCCRYGGCENEKRGGKYCSSHSNHCVVNGCDERGDLRGGYCSYHRCQLYSCDVPVSSGGYCSEHVDSCQVSGCSQRTNRYKRYCLPYHRAECEGKTRIYKCSTEILHGETRCDLHKESCEECGDGIPTNEQWCRDHKKKCEFENCTARINDYSNHCSKHPPQMQAEFYKNETERLRRQLEEMRRGQDEYQSYTEANYPPRSSRNN